MREIKFRAKELGTGKWVQGDLHILCTRPHIHHMLYIPDKSYIDLSTVGQFTGLHDKNGKEICEGDIVRFSMIEDASSIGYVAFHKRSASFRVIAEHTDFGIGNRYGLHESTLEVIGNCHDNPELLKQNHE